MTGATTVAEWVRARVAHILAIPFVLAALLHFHFRMVRRYGISGPL